MLVLNDASINRSEVHIHNLISISNWYREDNTTGSRHWPLGRTIH